MSTTSRTIIELKVAESVAEVFGYRKILAAAASSRCQISINFLIIGFILFSL